MFLFIKLLTMGNTPKGTTTPSEELDNQLEKSSSNTEGQLKDLVDNTRDLLGEAFDNAFENGVPDLDIYQLKEVRSLLEDYRYNKLSWDEFFNAITNIIPDLKYYDEDIEQNEEDIEQNEEDIEQNEEAKGDKPNYPKKEIFFDLKEMVESLIEEKEQEKKGNVAIDFNDLMDDYN